MEETQTRRLPALLPPLLLFALFIAVRLLAPAFAPVIDLALPFFGLIGLGYACAVVFGSPAEGLAWLNIFVVWLALPSLLFTLVAATPFAELANWRFMLCTGGATAATFALAFAGALGLGRAKIPEATIQAMAAAYANIGYMGPGLTLSLLGQAAAAPTALVFVTDTIFLFSVLPLCMAVGQRSGEGALRTFGTALWRIASHPFNVATVLGIAAAAYAWQPPAAMGRVLSLLSGAAAPCALFALGVTVALRPIRRLGREMPALLAAKLLLHPFIALLLLSLAGGFPRVWVLTAVLMASLPPALNVFVMASQYGVYVERASSAILIGTMASVVSVTILMWLVATNAMPTSLF